MVWTFMLLGAAFPDGLRAASGDLLLAAAALAASYVAATSANDLADEHVDRVNHPGDRARPLVTGEASRRDLRRLHLAAGAVALAAAAALGWRAVAVALVFLFLARIVLKDYRDRAGDAAYGKPTLLLRFGSTATCAVSFAALVLGAVLLPIALRPTLLVGTALLSLLVGASVLLWRLRGATDDRAEQVAIGLGARLGNGVLLVALAWLLMGGAGATEEARTAFVSLLALLIGVSVVSLAAHPDRVVIGYKG